jgi:PAS domain S-box-containing protein
MSSGMQRIYPLERRSLFALSLLFSFFIIMGAACIVGYNSYTKATDAAIHLNGTRATLLAKLILEHQRAAIGVLRAYSRRPLLIDSIKRKDFEGVLKHLADLVKSNPEVEWPYVANPDSTVWVNFPVDKGVFDNDLSGRDWYKGVSKEWKPYISAVYKMVVGEKDLAVAVSVPIFDEKGNLIGILGTAQSTPLFRKAVDEVISHSDAHMTLIDQQGHIVYSNRFPYTKEVIDYPSFDFVRRAMKGEKGNAEIHDSSDENRTKYVSFAPIEGLGWSIVVEKGKREVLRSEYSNFALITVISFLTFAVVALSLVNLRARQRQIRSLEKVNEELDGRVRERTTELEITNHNLTVEITERKKAEEALRESEQRWATTLASIGDAVIATDIDAKITFMNAVAEELTGWTLSEAMANPVTKVFDVVNEQTRQKAENPVTKVLEKGNGVGLADHTILVRKDGTEVPIDDSGSPIRDSKGKTTGVVLVFRDITERKQVEEAVKESEERLRFALETCYTGAWDLDLVNHTAHRSLQHDRIFGYEQPLPQWTYEMFLDHVLPEDREAVDAKFRNAIESQDEWSFECRIRRSDGEIRWIWAAGRHRKDMAGQVRRMVGIVQDITERKRAAEALRQNREDQDRAQEVGQIGSWRMDVRQNVLTWSDENHRIFGVPKGTPLTYETFLGIVHPEDRQYVDTRWQAGLRGEPYDLEHRIVVGQQVKWVREKAYLEFDDAGGLMGGFGITQDISERKRAESKLRESEQGLSALYSSMTEGVAQHEVIYDSGGQIIDYIIRNVNPAFETITGLSKDEIINKNASEIYGTGKAPYLDIYSRVMRSRQAESFETFFSPMKKYFHISVFSPAQGRFATVFEDITERKLAEESLRKAKDELEMRVQERTEELATSHHRLQQLASQLLQAQEKERKRVAVELHDSLLSELAAMKFLFEAKLMLLKKGRIADTNEFDKIRDIMQKVIKDVRGIMNNLRPSILDEMGLIPTIDWHFREYQKVYDHIQIRKQVEVLEKDIPDVLKIVIFRVLQEALNNFAKHGKGDIVDLSLWKSGNALHLRFQDNGQGFDMGGVRKGLGLESMRERVEFSLGSFHIESSEGKGTIIQASWNLPQNR